MSGPVLDRIDVFVEVLPLVGAALDADFDPSETSAAVRSRVVAARTFRAERWALRDGALEAGRRGRTRPGVERAHGLRELHPEQLRVREGLTDAATAALRDALGRRVIGGRGYVRALSVARTLADLDGTLSVSVEHVAEALSLREAPVVEGAW